MLSPNIILQNRYRIVRELGHGGMGTVYEAVDQRVNCIVALKETTAGNDPEAKHAFEREASLLANLRHSILPKVMDYFTEGDGDFLVMEFIPGYDLAELLESRESPFPQSQVLRWAFELLRVLEYLHRQEPPILHRDIKPSNLKLTKSGEVFLLDFGLAKGALGQMPTLAASRSVRGYTPVYASLEQIHGHGTDPRSDLYSLGATLYHLLSGIPPVDAPTRFHVIEDGERDPLKPITEVNSQASPNVCGVIHRAMALSRKDRPISATEMSKALRSAAEEDERNAAEEEYRRAEERHRNRGEEPRQPEEEAPRRAEDERAPQGAETRAKKEEAWRAEDRVKRDALNASKPGPTIPARDLERTQEIDGDYLKTIPAPPPERVAAEQVRPRATHPDNESTLPVRPKRVIKINAIAIGVLVVTGIILFIVRPWSQPVVTQPAVNSALTAPGHRIQVGMLPKAKGDPYFITCHQGAEEAAKELGVDLLWDGPTDLDPIKQNAIIEEWIARGVDVIAVSAENKLAISPVLRKAKEKRIKVITWDADAETDARDFMINQATPQGIGYTLTDEAARILNNKGEFAIITASLSAPNQNVWIKYIKERMAQKYPDLKLVAIQPSEGDRDRAFTETQTVLKVYPNVRLIMAIAAPAVPGAAEAVQQSGRTDVKVTGLSLPNMNKPYVHSGVVESLVLWNTVDLGYLTVYAANALSNGKLKRGDRELSAGRLGRIEVADDEVRLGAPFIFNKSNIDRFNF
jgi:ABC-type sugar transport system substrate-binding protein/serine/threonine protein kinase